ncbi:hypothetical protein [Carnobacterium antarcticum]|uniref:Glycosyltransferase RgtA/B/C/D-like domain-containing protein n=1 Tax=Carnobacterium antarcticum TaxID=2126436 RepID=A0ABW4NL86_9LACT|nr:hypothetical protein [Carnobacterium sp. CP1]
MMQQSIKRNINKIGMLFFGLSVISILIIGQLFFELSIINFILFLAYNVFYIYLPGKISVKLLKINNFTNMIEEILAFFLGMFMLIIQYYIFSFFNSLYLIKFFTPLLLIVGVIYLVSKKKLIFSVKKNKILDAGTYLFMGTNTLVSAIYTMFAFPKPTVVSNAVTYQDMAWHMGNVNILSSGSNTDTRVYGIKFLYHYFSDLFYAIAKYIFGFSAYELIIQFQFIIVGTILTISVIAFFKVMFKNSRYLPYFAAFALFYVPSAANGYYNNIFYHLFTNVNAMALTLPVVLLVLLVIKNSLEFKENKKNILLIFIFMFLLAGLKGPIALMILVALFVLTFAMLIQKKRNLFWLKFLMIATLSYAIIHFTLLSQGSDLVEIGMDTAFDVITSTSLFPGGLNNPDSNFFIRFTYVIPHFLLAVFFFSIPYLWSVIENIYKFFNRQYISLFDQFSLIFSVLSIGAYYIIRHSGYSQMYFLFGALPVIYYLGGKEVERLLKENAGIKFKIVFFVIMALVFMRPVLETTSMIKGSLKQSYSNFVNEQTDFFNSSISSLEYEGMMWIKNNTAPNDLLATNRHNDDHRFFLYSAYSDRGFYIEGPEYAKNSGLQPEKAQEMLERNDSLFSPDYQNKYNLAMELNVKYLVQYKKQQPNDLFTTESGFQRCFENDDISIYKVLK